MSKTPTPLRNCTEERPLTIGTVPCRGSLFRNSYVGRVNPRDEEATSSDDERHLSMVLSGLPLTEWKLLEPHAELIELERAEELFTGEEPNDSAYFPITSVISMMAQMKDGNECEYGCIGREGMLGLQAALGAQPLRGRALCQVEGRAIRVDSAILLKLMKSGEAPELHRLLLRYAQATINTLAQLAACNAVHGVNKTNRTLASAHS